MMNTYKISTLGLTLGVILLITGCGASTGNQKLAKLSTDQVSALFVKGQTTSQEVRARLGEPEDVDIDIKGNKKWLYSHKKSNLKAIGYIPYVNLISSGTDDVTKKLVIRFDKQDRVAEYAITSSKGESKWGLVN